jgi:hypothetical protein
LEAAGITSALQQRAVVQLVRDLKKAQLWTKMKAIYPFVGGTATTHKWNLKDPQDTDAAFRLTFSGGWTHSSNGALPNGTNAWADTYLVPNTWLTLNSTHLSYYSRTSTTEDNKTEIGCSSTFGTELPIMEIIIRRVLSSVPKLYSDMYDYSTTRLIVDNSTTQGLFLVNRTSSTVHNAFGNGSKLGTQTATSLQTSMPTISLPIGAYSQLTPSRSQTRYSSKECAFATIGDGFTDAEASLLYQCVDRYQKTLGRAV